MTSNPSLLVYSDEATSLWKSVLHAPSPRLSAATREALAQHTRALERRAGELRVAIDSAELESWLRGGQLSALETSLATLTDGATALALVPTDRIGSNVDPSFTFASFVASPANSATRARALAFARSGGAEGGALAIHGGRGSGKTHLLRAIAAQMAEQRLDPIVACGAEQLSLDLITAIGREEIEQFRARLDAAAALVVDDLEALVGRDATQEELARALDVLCARGIPIAVGLSRPADRLPGLIEPLRSALAQFTPLETRAPEWETRVAIVVAHARRWGAEPSDPVAAFLATKLRSVLGELDATLTRLMTRASAGNALFDLEVVKRLLNETGGKPVEISTGDVLNAVAHQFNVRVRDLRSHSRSARVTVPRQVAMYLMRRYCGRSYPDIGRIFSRHHTTALHSDRVVQSQLGENASLRAAVVLVEKELLRVSEGGG
jgi:chromosomal replication initiator protein